MVKSWWWWLFDDEYDDDFYDINFYEDSKTYVLCMIYTCYVIYVMVVDHALIVKFYTILVCLL